MGLHIQPSGCNSVKREHSPPFKVGGLGLHHCHQPIIIMKIIEKIIARHELKEIKDNWFAVKPRLNEYYVLYGNDGWVRRYREHNIENWNKHMQEGR